MGSLSDKNISSPQNKNNINTKGNTYQDEINLIDYLKVIWKKRYLIIFGSLLPAFISGLALYFLPRDYRITYTYEMGLNEKKYQMLLDKFYSAENLNRIISKLNVEKQGAYADKVAKAKTQELLSKLVAFEVTPTFFNSIKNLKTNDIRNIEQIQEAEGTLLTITITGRPFEDMPGISSVVRDNFENIIPMYTIRRELNDTIADMRTEMAEMEEQRFEQELDVKKKKAILAKLKDLKPEESAKGANDIILQFNSVDANSTYLPLSYQIQTTESTLISLEEGIKSDEEKYRYYISVLNLNERIFDEIRKKQTLFYSTQQFHPFLVRIVDENNEKEIQDYLKAYIKKIENTMFANIPVIEEPKIYPVPKGTIRKSSVVFAISLIVMTFAAFLLEAVDKGRT